MKPDEEKGLKLESPFLEFSGYSPQPNELQEMRRSHRRHSHRWHRRRRYSPARKRLKLSDSCEERRRRHRAEWRQEVLRRKVDSGDDELEGTSTVRRSQCSVATQVSNSLERCCQTKDDTENLTSFTRNEVESPRDLLCGEVGVQRHIEFITSKSAEDAFCLGKTETDDQIEVQEGNYFSDSFDEEESKGGNSISSCSSSSSSSSSDQTTLSEPSNLTDYQGWILSYEQSDIAIEQQPEPCGPIYSTMTMDDELSENEDGFFESRRQKREAASLIPKDTTSYFHCSRLTQFLAWIKRSSYPAKPRETSSQPASHQMPPSTDDERSTVLLGHDAWLKDLLLRRGFYIKSNPVIVRTRRSLFRLLQNQLRRAVISVIELLRSFVSKRTEDHSTTYMHNV